MLIYASSGPEYLSEHGEAFIRSAERHGHQVKIDLATDFPEWRKRFRCNYDKVFYCGLRYLRLPELLTQDILMLDIDSIINHPIKVNEPCDMALFFRPWLPGLEVLMTASYWTPKAKPFAEAVRDKMLARNNKWGSDQIIVWKTYKEIGDQFDIGTLSQNFACYNFDRDAPIWTAKGPTRKNNETYLARRAEYVS